ncbi:MAG: S53 family peptidase [Deltaproteobacteria bacterium]|nr:S53 family peptidase [Deltaproteobacteria bacterium]
MHKGSLSAGLVYILVSFALGCGAPQAVDDAESSIDDRPAEIVALAPVEHRALCGPAAPGQMRCHARLVTVDGGISPARTASGLTPADLQDAYALPVSLGRGKTVAIVDAQDDPSAERDLNQYRVNFGIPGCTGSNGCFKKVNQRGQRGAYPSAEPGWAGEIALDLDMVSAACPNCHILLVEADSASMTDLGEAVNTAVRLGADAVSMSWGGAESSGDVAADAQFLVHPGVALVASAGDDGYGVEFPAASPHVTAVGGTSLAHSTNARGWIESTWGSASGAGTGSGCSTRQPKPAWQTDGQCHKRMVADVSAVADPSTGVAVFDGYGSGGWIVVGGTSAASPLVAATLALTGHSTDALGFAYRNRNDFFDVASGKNGSCSSASSYFCHALGGYDGPTGMGTPNGTAMLRGAHPVSGGGHDAGGCQSCTASSDCAHGEHCLEDTAHSSGKFCAPDCTADHASCPSGYSCADLNGTSWGCRPEPGTCS